MCLNIIQLKSQITSYHVSYQISIKQLKIEDRNVSEITEEKELL